MKLVIDIEANSLTHPTEIWCICCKNIDTGEWSIFREVTRNAEEADRFRELLRRCSLLVGHNILGYDCPVIDDLLGCNLCQHPGNTLDTLVLSRLIDYPRKKHSIEDYGLEFGYPKIKFSDFSQYSLEMENYCVRDVEIAERVYRKYLRYINNPDNSKAISLEHRFAVICNDLSRNGFAFDSYGASKLLTKVTEDLAILDKDILKQFPPKLKLIREVTPRETKHGTIAKNSIPKALGVDYTKFTVGSPFCYCEWKDFNPASPKQVVEVLWSAGWVPEDKTDTHVDTERELSQLKRLKRQGEVVDTEPLYAKLKTMEIYGWRCNEANLTTLPANAPAPARTLAQRILLESRRRTLTEWLGLCDNSSRIHGKFQGIGAWTHRMAHQKPNTANIPNEKDNSGRIKLLGAQMRKLWVAPKKRLLVGVDAEGIQLRIFAHYVDLYSPCPELIKALVNGKKEDKTDPHSVNKEVLGNVCKARQAAKRFLYALFLGAGLGKLAAILECSKEEAEQALGRLIKQYPGFSYLKTTVFPADAKRGYFTALDGRPIVVPGEDLGTKRHLMMSGYLQSGEAIVMKMATIRWYERLPPEAKALLVDLVHDEWQIEVENNVDLAIEVAKCAADALREVGEELKLHCPLAGSYWNDDLKDYTIGTNWKVTH